MSTVGSKKNLSSSRRQLTLSCSRIILCDLPLEPSLIPITSVNVYIFSISSISSDANIWGNATPEKLKIPSSQCAWILVRTRGKNVPNIQVDCALRYSRLREVFCRSCVIEDIPPLLLRRRAVIPVVSVIGIVKIFLYLLTMTLLTGCSLQLMGSASRAGHSGVLDSNLSCSSFRRDVPAPA